MSSGVSGWRTKTRVRDSSAPMTSKLGFSVVAPIRMMVPSSEAVLLGLVEPVDLVHEQDGLGAARLEPLARLAYDLANARHPLGDGAEGDELPLGGAGHQVGQRRLPAPGWAPEDHRAWSPPLDGIT
jgi:hypothetical protein